MFVLKLWRDRSEGQTPGFLGPYDCAGVGCMGTQRGVDHGVLGSFDGHLCSRLFRVCELSGHSVSLDMSGCSVCTFDFCGVRISMAQS